MKKYKGTIWECLKHLASTNPSLQVRSNLTKFVGADTTAVVNNWLLGKHKPKGTNLIRIQYWLRHNGYEIEELKNLDSATFNLREMVALSVIDIREIAERIGLSYDHLMQVMKGTYGVAKHREQIISVYQEYESEVTQAREEHGISSDKPESLSSGTQIPKASSKPCPDPCWHCNIIESAANQVNSLLPLADLLLSDGFSPEDREAFRRMVGKNGVFRLSNLLNGLCSEKAMQVSGASHSEKRRRTDHE